MSFGTFFLDIKNMDSILFAIFKIPRWLRLSELDNRIDEIVEYFKDTKTYSEI